MNMNRKSAWREYLAEFKKLDLASLPVAESVANGSFEDGAGDTPDGWQLAVGELGVSTAWQPDGGIDGGRCLRISPRGGGASWYGSPVAVTPGAEYVFQCAMKRDGNRHWAHACEVNWVSLVFVDASGVPVRQDPDHDQPLVLVRCRRTDNWVQAWRRVVAPADAKALLIGFCIVRGEPSFDDAYGFRRLWHGDIDTGDWWVDDVRLERVPLEVAPSKGTLTIRLPEGGARLRVTSDAGETFAPEDSIAYTHGGGCFHALREEVQLGLAPGSYGIEAVRGFQRRLYSSEVTVAANADAVVDVQLPRFVDWPKEGWYEGDHHNHLSFHGATRYPMMSIDDVCRVARGEGMDFLSFCGELVDQHAYADWRDAGCPDGARPDGAFEAEGFVCSVSHEVTQDLLGHVCLVNAPGHIAPGHPSWLIPTNEEVFQEVARSDRHGTEGAVVMAHPYHALTEERLLKVLTDPAVTCLQREMPVDIALGYAHTMDFLSVEEPANLDIRFRDYFRLLNLGLRIGVSGASDAYADQGTEIVGSLRTMVKADRFDMNAIARGYRGQRTVATNGPLLRLCVNDACPGDTVAGPWTRIRADAYSNWGLTRVEIVVDGEVVADATPGEDGWARLESEILLERSGWVVARCWGPGHYAINMQSLPEDQHHERGQWAVSSPVYVDVPGKPIVPRREDAEYFMQWIDASCEAIRGRKAFLEGQDIAGLVMKDGDVQRALDLFQRGRAVYERMV